MKTNERKDIEHLILQVHVMSKLLTMCGYGNVKFSTADNKAKKGTKK